MEPYRYAYVFDFDGTIAQTFIPSPNGVGVEQGYRLACEELFGSPAGAELFAAAGGLSNRSPGEFVKAILDVGDEPVLVEQAKAYLDGHASALVGYVPPDKGAELHWSDERSLAVITELCVRIKLKILTSQVGTQCADGTLWPLPCNGFIELWRGVEDFNLAYGEAIIVPGIISSGHDLFIQKCFRTWGLTPPEFILSDDTMRSNRYRDLSHEERRKPHPGLFKIFCQEWLCAGNGPREEDPLRCLEGRAFYAGDSLKDDGQFARNVGVPFLWFNPQGKEPSGFAGKLVNVADWAEASGRLLSQEAVRLMRNGRTFEEILNALYL